MKTNINSTVAISAIITRANGTKEDLGVISHKKVNIASKLLEKIKGNINGNSLNHSR